MQMVWRGVFLAIPAIRPRVGSANGKGARHPSATASQPTGIARTLASPFSEFWGGRPKHGRPSSALPARRTGGLRPSPPPPLGFRRQPAGLPGAGQAAQFFLRGNAWTAGPQTPGRRGRRFRRSCQSGTLIHENGLTNAGSRSFPVSCPGRRAAFGPPVGRFA